MSKKDKKKGFFGEFKEFVMRGNVIDMAVGVIIASSFGKITTSLVNDVLMPFLGWIIGDIDLSNLNITLVPATLNEAGVIEKEAVVIGIGNTLVTVIDFIIIAFVIFTIIKCMNKASKIKDLLIKKEEEEEETKEADEEKKPTSEELLSEILDEIKKKNATDD